MSILTAYRDKQEQKQEHFLHYNVHFVNPNMSTSSSFGTRASYSDTSCVCGFFFFRFFQSYRPTQYQETHQTLNEKKGGWPNLERMNEIYRRSKVPVVSYLCAFL